MKRFSVMPVQFIKLEFHDSVHCKPTKFVTFAIDTFNLNVVPTSAL